MYRYKFIIKLLERERAYERQERGTETPGIFIVLCSLVCLIWIWFDQLVTCDSIKFAENGFGSAIGHKGESPI